MFNLYKPSFRFTGHKQTVQTQIKTWTFTVYLQNALQKNEQKWKENSQHP